jgi:hypothetical protein
MKLSIGNNTLRWPVLLLAAAFTVACGSSGGGSDDVDDDDVINILPLYAYQLTSAIDDPITVTLPGGTLSLQLSHLFEGPGLFGEYHPASGNFSVFAGSSMVVDELILVGLQGNQLADVPTLFGDFSVQATVDWFVPADSDPDTGALVVARGDERIEVAVIDGGNTVRLRHDATGDGVYEEEVSLTWQEFDDLGDFAEAPEWQLLGSFAYDATIEFMFELAQAGIDGFEFIDEDLAQGGQRIIQCSAFSDLGLAVPPPPPVIPDQGTLTFSWLDDGSEGGSGPDGVVGVGDSFNMAFAYCVDDDPEDDIDDMLNGEIGLNSFTEVVTENTTGSFITRIGWEGPGVAARPGGIEFKALERWEVFDADGDGAGTTAGAELTSVVDGRMVMVFFEP